MRILRHLTVYIVGVYTIGVYGITNPQLHYIESAWVPESVMLQEGISHPRKLEEDEVILQSCDVNSDGIPDFFFSNIHNINGRAGYIWTPYLSGSDGEYQKVKGICFHAFNQGGAFCSDDGAIYSSWSGGADGGSVVKITRTPAGWNEEQYATFKRTDNLSTIVEAKDGRSIVVKANGNLLNEIRDNLISAPSHNGTIPFLSGGDSPLKSNVSVNADVSKGTQETEPMEIQETGTYNKSSTSKAIMSANRIWIGAVMILMALLGLLWLYKRKAK